jgi:hypothetical protein
MTAAVLIAVSALVWQEVSCARAGQTPSHGPTPPKFRIPADEARPVCYRVDLTIIPDQDTFAAAIDLDLGFAEQASVLWLNAEKLEIPAVADNMRVSSRESIWCRNSHQSRRIARAYSS